MIRFLDGLFGCAHRHCTFPITAKKLRTLTAEGKYSTTTYIVCLDCGKEFPYDWQEMKMVAPTRMRRDDVDALEPVDLPGGSFPFAEDAGEKLRGKGMNDLIRLARCRGGR